MSTPVQAVAEALAAAHRQHRTIAAAPFESLLQDAEQAYAVQEEVARTLGWFERPVPQHWKSGGPSRTTPLTNAALPRREGSFMVGVVSGSLELKRLS